MRAPSLALVVALGGCPKSGQTPGASPTPDTPATPDTPEAALSPRCDALGDLVDGAKDNLRAFRGAEIPDDRPDDETAAVVRYETTLLFPGAREASMSEIHGSAGYEAVFYDDTWAALVDELGACPALAELDAGEPADNDGDGELDQKMWEANHATVIVEDSAYQGLRLTVFVE